MTGYKGYSGTDDIRYCPSCCEGIGEWHCEGIGEWHADGTGTCRKCGRRFGALETGTGETGTKDKEAY